MALILCAAQGSLHCALPAAPGPGPHGQDVVAKLTKAIEDLALVATGEGKLMRARCLGCCCLLPTSLKPCCLLHAAGCEAGAESSIEDYEGEGDPLTVRTVYTCL